MENEDLKINDDMGPLTLIHVLIETVKKIESIELYKNTNRFLVDWTFQFLFKWFVKTIR